MRDRIRILPEAWFVVVPLLLLAAASLLIQWYIAAIIFITLVAIVTQLFRDPRRSGSPRPVDLLAPADGTVISIGSDAPEGASPRIGIASSPFDVLVLRAPLNGRIVDSQQTADGSQVITIEGGGTRVGIAWRPGILSQRPDLEKKVGDDVARGERVGRLRFGSRVDLLLPANAAIRVRLQERVKVGLSVVAEVE